MESCIDTGYKPLQDTKYQPLRTWVLLGYVYFPFYFPFNYSTSRPSLSRHIPFEVYSIYFYLDRPYYCFCVVLCSEVANRSFSISSRTMPSTSPITISSNSATSHYRRVCEHYYWRATGSPASRRRCPSQSRT